MSLQGNYYIDGKDLYTTFGVVIKRAPDELLRFPKRKQSITHDWGDANGVDVDLTKPFFESRDISLDCIFISTTKAEFWGNHDAFMNEWRKPGTRRLRVEAFERDFYVFYKDCSNFDRFTKIKDGKIICEFTIVVTEMQPQFASETSRLVDQEGNYLIA